MKKFLCIAISVMMLLTLSAYADEYDDLYKNQYLSYEADFTCEFIVDKPMDVLNAIPNISAVYNFADIQALAEGLANSECNGKIKANINEDFTKGKLSLEMFSTVPLRINRNLKITSEQVVGTWIDFDITDEINPKITYIYATPFTDKYVIFDLPDIMDKLGINSSDFVSVLKNNLNKEKINEISDKAVDIIRNNSSLSSKGTISKIDISGSQLNNIITEFASMIKSMLKDNADYELLSDTETSTIADSIPDSEKLSEDLNNLSLFAENALTMEFAKNPDGTIKSGKETVSFALDIEKIASFFGSEFITEKPSTVNFSLSSSVIYKNVNNNVNVDFPYLTEENSVSVNDLAKQVGYTPDYDWDGENCFHDEYAYIGCDYIPASDSMPFIPIKDLTQNFNKYGHKYLITKSGNDVTVTDENGLERFSAAKLTIGSYTINVDGNEFTLKDAPTLYGTQVGISKEAADIIFGVKIDYASISLDENIVDMSLERRSPMCHHTEEEINGEDDFYDENYGECEHYIAATVSSNMPYNGIPYVILRDLTDQMFWYNGAEYDLSYDNGVVTLTDIGGTENFNTVTITNGSNIITVDGTEYKSSHPAQEYDDLMYIDDSAANIIFGSKMYKPALYYDNYDVEEHTPTVRFNAVFARKIPTCTHSDEEIDYFKWWED